MKYTMDKQTKKLLAQAKEEAKEMGNGYVGSEHLLLAVLKDPSTSLARLLKEDGLEYSILKQDLLILFGNGKKADHKEILLSHAAEEILERAEQHRSSKQQKELDADCLIEALLCSGDCVAAELLHRYDLDTEQLLKHIQATQHCELDRYAELRNLAQTGYNHDISGRERELEQMITILLRKDKANPLLLGEAGVGKSALVEYLAWRLEHGSIAQMPGDTRIYELHLNTLVAGTRYRGDFEEKLQNILRTLKKYPNVIVFIDELHQMIGAGKSEGSIDVSSVLKPCLARGELRCIGATTLDEYEMYIEKDRALERRFQPVLLKEPTAQEALVMLEGKRKSYESYHKVRLEKGVLPYIIEQSELYISERRFPDKAMDILDLSCVSAREKKDKTVRKSDVLRVVEDMTGIPLAKGERLQKLEHVLHETIYGQRKVIAQVLAQMKWIDEKTICGKTLGIWLFAGEEGAGKHTLLSALCKEYFQKTSCVELDMTCMEAMLGHAVLQLRRTPYTVLCIRNIQRASYAHMLYVKQALENGSLEDGKRSARLSRTLVVFLLDTPLQESGSLHFLQEASSWNKELPQPLFSLLDEVFLFEPLKEAEKLEAAASVLKRWKHTMEETALMEIVSDSTSLKQLERRLKKKLISG